MMNHRSRLDSSSRSLFSVRRLLFFLLLFVTSLSSLLLVPRVSATIINESAHRGHEMPAHGGHSGHASSSSAALQGGTPMVTIVSPSSGVTLNSRDVEVTFQLSDHVVGTIGTPHIHFHLDGDPIPYMMFNGNDPAQFGQQAVLFDFDFTSRVTWVNPTTVRFNALTNGVHTLRVHLVDGQHNILANPEATTTMTFSVDVPADDASPPDALVFVKEQPNENGMGRVFDNDPNIIGDLFLLAPVAANGTLTQLTDVAKNGGGVSDPEVSADGQRILFAMKQNPQDTWHICEINVNGTGFRQITSDPPYQKVNDTDPDYLPDGGIIFASDRLKQRDEYNVTLSTQLYTAKADGSDITMVEPNPSHSFNPQVIRDGRVVFNRWDHLAHRNIFTNWHMNQDGSSGFVFFGGASPRGSERLDDAQGIEPRQLEEGQMVGIFTHRSDLPGRMAIYDNRNGDLEDLAEPMVLGPQGLYRTPHPLTTNELIYSYSTGDDIRDDTQAQFGLYTMPLTPEEVLVDDDTEETAPGTQPNGQNLSFRLYQITLDAPSRVYVEITGSADDNGDSDDDDLWTIIDGVEYRNRLERRLDGNLIEGLVDTFRVDADLAAGTHTIQVATDETPTLSRVRIVRAIRGGEQTVLYDDPNSNEVSPVPVRSRTVPPVYPSKVNFDLSWGTFLIRDVSLRGDFRQPNHNSSDGDPDFHFHLDLEKLKGLRVFQSVPRRDHSKDLLVGAHGFDPVRVLGLATHNQFGTSVFQAPANNTTAWDLVGHDGEAIVHERVWSLVVPGEVRACGGCHVPQLPFRQREIGAIPAPTDLRTRGRVYAFVDDVLPLLEENCVSCHTGASPAGGLDLRGDRASYDALHERVDERTPREYINDGDARTSFLLQLLTANARGNSTHQTRIDAINATSDHTGLLTSDELYELATTIDLGSGFAYLPDGVESGAPRVVGVLPAPGSTNVSPHTGVAIEFDAPMDRATVDSSTFTLRQVGGSSVPGRWRWGNDRQVIFDPINTLTGGEYEVELSGNLVDIKRDSHSEEPGEALAASFSSRFTVGSNSDSTPPQISQIVPSGSASPINPIVVRFDEPIEPGSVSELTLWVEASNGAWIEGRVGVSADGMEAAFAPRTPFDVGETYTLHVGNDIRDLAGNSLSTSRSHDAALTGMPARSTPSPSADANNRRGESSAQDGEGYKLFIGDALKDDQAQRTAASPSDTTHSFTIGNTPAAQHHSLIAERDTGNWPEKVAVNSDGTRVLVANHRSDSVSFYDGTNWNLLNTFTDVGNDPFDIAFSSDSKQAYVLNTGSDDVRILRLLDGVTLATVTGMVNPQFMALNHAGNRLYVADKGDPDALHEIDVDASSGTFGQILRSLNLDRQPHDIAVSPDDKLLYFSASRALTVVDVELWLEKEVIDLAKWSISEMALSPDGRQAVVSSPHDDILNIIDLITGQPIVEFPLDEAPDSVVYSPDGRFIYVTERDSRTIAIIDVATLQVVRRVPVSGTYWPEGLAISPDGGKIYLAESGYPGKLRVFHLADLADTTGPQVTQLEPSNNGINVPTHAPLRIDLSEAVDRLTANSETIRLEHNGRTIGGQIRISDDNRSIWFWPRAALQPNRIYTLHVTNGMRDLSNNALSNEQSVNFFTAKEADVPPLGLWATPDSGHNPRGVALTPDGSLALSTDYWNNRLYLIDTSSWQSETLDLGGRVSHITIRPDGLLAYVLRPEEDMVMVVDLTSNSVIDMDAAAEGLQGITVGDKPDSLLYHPTDARLYVVNQNSSDISVIDTNTHQETARWPVNGVSSEDRDAHGIAISPNHEHLYVTSRYRVSVMDADNGQVVNLLDGLPGWSQYGIVVTPDGNQLWFTSESTDELVAIDLRLNEVVSRIAVGDGPTWLTLSPDGETIYVINRWDGSVSVVQWRTGSVLNTLTYSGELHNLAISPNGQQLYLTNSLFDSLLVYQQANAGDETGPQLTQLSPSEGTQDVSVIAPLTVQFDEALDRRSINRSTLRVVPSDTTARSPEELDEAAISGDYIISSDNRTVTFMPDQPWRPDTGYTLHLEGGLTDLAGNSLGTSQTSDFRTAAVLDPIPLSARAEQFTADEAWSQVLSPDGSILAVSNRHRDTVSLIDPANLTLLHTISTGDEPLGLLFNGDGSRLYVVHRRDNSLVEVNVNTQQVLRTITGLTDAEHVLLSQDGTKAYVTGYNSNGVDEVDLTTEQVTTQIQEMEKPGEPTYSPDGTLYVPALDGLWRYNGTWSKLVMNRRYYLDMGFSADGRYAYLSQPWDDQLAVVDLQMWDSEQVYQLNVGDEPRQIAQSSDKRVLVVANARDGTLQVIDTLTHQTIQSADIAGGWLSSLFWDEARGRLFVGETVTNRVHLFNLSYTSGADKPTILALNPQSTNSAIGQTFTVDLQVQTSQPINGAAAYLNFDASLLEVVSITAGSSLPNVETNNFDNTTGQIDFVASSHAELASNFVLATVTFNTLGTSDGTLLTFNDQAPRQSDVSKANSSLLEQTQAGSVSIAASTSLAGSITMEGRPAAPDARWSTSLTVRFYESGTQTEVYSFTPTTDQEGKFTLSNLHPGSYDVSVKGAHTLQTLHNVSIVAGSNTFDFGTLLEGDADNDNLIALSDFSILAATFGKCQADEGYDERADFNQDNCVTMSDFSLLSTNFGSNGEGNWPSRRRATRLSMGDVIIGVVPGLNAAKAGERFTVAVQIEAGSQLVDGSAAYLDFDANVMRVTHITQGNVLPFVLQNSFDNQTGQINLAAGAFNDYPTGTFDLAQIEFELIQEGVGSRLTFHFDEGARRTDVTFSGTSVLGTHRDGAVNGEVNQLYLPVVIGD